MLIVYTSHHRLIIYTYTDAISAKTVFKQSVTLSDENPNLENSKLVQLDYIQEL